MREYLFKELGYFTERECEAIRETFDSNPTFMRFKVSWSNEAGNCTLIVKTDYPKHLPDKEVKNFFLSAALSALSR